MNYERMREKQRPPSPTVADLVLVRPNAERAMTRQRLFRRSMILLCASVALSLYAAEKNQYLSFWPTKVRLTGFIEQRTFPGPPEFSDIKKGDTPEHVWIMRLDHPVSVKPAPGDHENETVEHARGATVYFYERYGARHWERLLGKHVEVTGVLFSAINAHPRTDISMRAEAIVAK
jgi:hypothetical protein